MNKIESFSKNKCKKNKKFLWSKQCNDINFFFFFRGGGASQEDILGLAILLTFDQFSIL